MLSYKRICVVNQSEKKNGQKERGDGDSSLKNYIDLILYLWYI